MNLIILERPAAELDAKERMLQPHVLRDERRVQSFGLLIITPLSPELHGHPPHSTDLYILLQ